MTTTAATRVRLHIRWKSCKESVEEFDSYADGKRHFDIQKAQLADITLACYLEDVVHSTKLFSFGHW